MGMFHAYKDLSRQVYIADTECYHNRLCLVLASYCFLHWCRMLLWPQIYYFRINLLTITKPGIKMTNSYVIEYFFSRTLYFIFISYTKGFRIQPLSSSLSKQLLWSHGKKWYFFFLKKKTCQKRIIFRRRICGFEWPINCLGWLEEEYSLW
jgi:hypothetical protein